MTYLSFLSWLIAFGPKIPQLLAIIEQLAELFAPPATDSGELQMTALTPEEEELQAELLALCAPAADGAMPIADGSRLQGLFAWLKKAGLLNAILGLIPRG